MSKNLPALLLGALLAGACAAPSPPALPRESSTEVTQEMAALPGAVIAEGSGAITYPGETLFSEGAALPLPGGVAVLDPLADFLAGHPERRWRARVRAWTGLSEGYDRALAGKRVELLGRYFLKRGIPAERVEWFPEGAQGPPLEIGPAVSQSASDASSSRSKP